MREIKIRPIHEDKDYQFKLEAGIRFLKEGDQLKITVMFRGREVAHPEKGEVVLLEFAKDLEKYAKAGLPPVSDGRQMWLLFTPKVGV